MLEGVEQRLDQLPTDEATLHLGSGLGEVRSQERVGQPRRGHRLRDDPSLGTRVGRRGRSGRRSIPARVEPRGALHLALDRARGVADLGVLVEQDEERRLERRDVRQDRGHPVQALELDVPLRLGEGLVGPDAGALHASQQRHRLEPGALPRVELPTLDSALHHPDRLRKHRDDAVVVAAPTVGTLSASGCFRTGAHVVLPTAALFLVRGLLGRAELAAAARRSVRRWCRCATLTCRRLVRSPSRGSASVTTATRRLPVLAVYEASSARPDACRPCRPGCPRPGR